MKTINIFFIAFLLFAINIGVAAPSGPPAPGGGSNPSCWPVCVPIDGGLVFLIAAATLYGGIKMYEYQKKIKAKI